MIKSNWKWKIILKELDGGKVLAFGANKKSDSGTLGGNSTSDYDLNILKHFENLKQTGFILIKSLFYLSYLKLLIHFEIKNKGSHLNKTSLRHKNLVSKI